MAGIEGAALGAAVSLGLGAYNATSGFSARHDLTHDAQVAETRKLVDDFEKLRKSGDMADEDYDVYLERKDIAIQSDKAYRDSISDFKSTSAINFVKKWRKKGEVRKRKRQAREANQNLHDHYYDSSSCSSDSSSITAASGSPPQASNIRGWADGVIDEDGDDGEEDWRGYGKGGYHPVEIGDKLSDGRYVVVRKLGWGHLSTVWLAKDLTMDYHVALKIAKSSSHDTEIAMGQIKVLKLLTPSAPPLAPPHPGGKHLLSFLDHFQHRGPNGVHVCMVFEVFGENLLDLIKRRRNEPLPMPFVKRIAKEIFLGLDYMHRSFDVIHTDLKPENIYICIDAITPTELKVVSSVDRQTDESSEAATEKITVKIANLGHSATIATWVDPRKNDMVIQQYRCPEVILGAKWWPSSDIWSVACMFFELITGHPLFHHSTPFKHIVQIIQLLGNIPRSVVDTGSYSRKFFDREGELKYDESIHPLPLDSLLEHSFPEVEVDALAAFLKSMLHLDPEKRANASELIHHEFLQVQGGADCWNLEHNP